MLGEESLGLLELLHELCLSAGVIFVNIEEVVDSLAIFLVEFSTEAHEHGLQFLDVNIHIVVDVATSEQFLV